MPITIGRNIASFMAQRNLGETTESLSRVYERLSSGQRINRASDDAAGLAIASRLNSDAKVLSQGIRNLNDGLSLANIADSALSALGTIVTRMQELAEQSANGTYSSTQRTAMNTEVQALSAEYLRISQSTKYNGIDILNGSSSQFIFQGGYSSFTLDLSSGGSASTVSGTGQITAQSMLSTGQYPNEQTIGDFNGDGYGDIAGVFNIAGSSTGVMIHLGNGDGTFQAGRSYAGGTGNGIETADFNRDGRADLIATNPNGVGGVQVWMGNGDGSFGTVSYYGGWTSRGVDIGDVNGDGFIDAVSSDTGFGTFMVLLNNGNGTFLAPRSYASVTQDRDPILLDFNNDGKLDVLATSMTTAQWSISFGNGDGSFANPVVYSMPAANAVLSTAGDLNGDGYADVVIADYANGKMDIFMNNGNGTFAAVKSYGPAAGLADFTSPQLADLNGDDNLDIVVATSGNNAVNILFGNGDGSFRAVSSVAVGAFADIVVTGDLNLDGVADVVVSDFSNPGHLIPFLTQTTTAAGSSSLTVADIIEIPTINITTQSGARSALTTLAMVQQTIESTRTVVGAFESRLEISKENLAVTTENVRAAAGRILDADIAEEVAKMVRLQIRQQATSAILAQANLQPQMALKLLT